MDNLTHTFFGIVGSKALTRRDEARFKKAAFWTSVVAANLPDLSMPLEAADKLHFLLEHRAYSHSVWAVLPIGIIAAALGTLLKRGKASWIFKLSIVGILAAGLHIFADFLNDYGVHPLSPFYNKWFYGDSLFIVEPLFWFAILPLLFREAEKRVTKIIWSFVTFIALVLIWFSGYYPYQLGILVTFWLIAAFFATRICRNNVLVPISLVLIVIAVFAFASMTVKSRVVENLKNQRPAEMLIQVAAAPAPSNPLCWRIVSVSRDTPGDDKKLYSAKLGVYSFFPEYWNPAECYPRLDTQRTAPLAKETLKSTEKTYWIGEFRSSIAELKRLIKKNECLKAYLSYARAPYWIDTGTSVVMGDLRYDFEPSLGFAEVNVENTDRCDFTKYNWNYPIGSIN